jgi:hypothetical protein
MKKYLRIAFAAGVLLCVAHPSFANTPTGTDPVRPPSAATVAGDPTGTDPVPPPGAMYLIWKAGIADFLSAIGV